MKAGLLKSINSYNRKYAEQAAGNAGMNQVYGAALQSLQNQRTKLKSEVPDTALSAPLEINNKTRTATGEVNQKKMDEKRRELEELDRRIARYQNLLAQSRNTHYFDSSVAFSKTQGIKGSENLSFKQLAKSGNSLIPDGKSKQLFSGITSLDAGMFPKNASKYTMAGQMVKGVDMGYDLGFCTAEATVGNTQYIGRDGSLDKYTCYGVAAATKLVNQQQATLRYYGYSANKAIYKGDGFFKNASVSAPTFFKPVHILSAVYDGQILKCATVSLEHAVSVQLVDGVGTAGRLLNGDSTAHQLTVEGNIPKTTVVLEGNYSKTGTAFENLTLPVSLSGTEQIKLGGSSDFFHSFLSAGMEYNRLVQSNFTSKGHNTRWGFHFRTNSKRYPAVSLSYKPFSTFRSYTDTLAVPQRPLLGEVWTGKATWQVKKQDNTLRFLLLYNKCNTIMDTVSYGNILLHFTTMYSGKLLTGSASTGKIIQAVPSTQLAGNTMSGIMSFLNLGCSYKMSQQLSVSGNQDFGYSGFGFSRYSTGIGTVCSLEKVPIAIRASLRYSTFRLDGLAQWQQLANGNIDLTWRFRTKTNNSKN